MSSARRIIVALDDSRAALARVESLLADRGYRVVPVEGWPGLLPEIRAAEPGLLILDLNMPALPGEVVGKVVRRLFPELPIVFLSGEDEDRIRAASEGVERSWFLRKGPTLAAELGPLIDRILGGVGAS